MTRRLSLRLAPVLEFLEGDAEASKKAKKSKNLPRGDYLEFVRLTSVGFIAVLHIIVMGNVQITAFISIYNKFLPYPHSFTDLYDFPLPSY